MALICCQIKFRKKDCRSLRPSLSERREKFRDISVIRVIPLINP